MKLLRPEWMTALAGLLLAFPAAAQESSSSGGDAAKAVERAAARSMMERLSIPDPDLDPPRSREEELFGEVLRTIESEYYDADVTRAELLEAAIQGMLDYLNRRSIRRLGTPGGNALLSPDEHERIRQNLSGQISGIGVVARREATSGAFEIVRVLDDSPGMRAGLRPGDRIVAIDSLPVAQIGIQGAIQLLRGQPGTPVKLGVRPSDDDATSEVDVVRGSFRVAQVSAQRIDACTGYLRIPNFGPGVAEATTQALMQFTSDGVTSLVLDLRDNPGGALDEAVDVAALFLEKDSPVVRLQTRSEKDQVARTSDDPIFTDPVTILVDSRTGGAAEVLASALEANRRAALVGNQTSGRATAESIFGLSTGAAIRLSTAVYRDPLGRSWAGSGLKPLVAVAPNPYSPGDPVDPAMDRAQALLQSLRPCQEAVEDINAPRPAQR